MDILLLLLQFQKEIIWIDLIISIIGQRNINVRFELDFIIIIILLLLEMTMFWLDFMVIVEIKFDNIIIGIIKLCLV